MGNAGTVIIGTGFMGAVHVEALKRIGIPVVGILGSTKQKSEQFAKAHQIGRAYGAMEEVLRDSNVNAVHLCTPNRFHYEAAKEAFMGMGFPEWQTDGIMELYKLIDSESDITNDKSTGDIEKITGEKATDMEGWCQQNAAGFQ